MKRLEIIPVGGFPELTQGMNLASELAKQFLLEEGDVVVVSSKAISKVEGRVINAETVDPSPFAYTLAQRIGRDPVYCELVLRESTDVVRMGPGVVICRTRHGFVLANAGVDTSNSGGIDRYVLLPLDPDSSARQLRQELLAQTGVRVAVIVSDTFGRAWRIGETDLAIGVAGLAPLSDFQGTQDRNGRTLNWSSAAWADELASAAELVRGKASGIPVVIVRGFEPSGEGCAQELIMPPQRDLFR